MNINNLLLKVFTPFLSFLLQKRLNKLKQNISSGKVIFYGAGILLKFMLKHCNTTNINIIGVTDSKYIAEKPSTFCGLQCINPEKLKNYSTDYVVLSVLEADKIKNKSSYLKNLKQELILNLIDNKQTLFKIFFKLSNNPKSIPVINKFFNIIDFTGRLITANKRELPNFIVVGISKGGTSSLRYYLNQHPRIHMNISAGCCYYTFTENRKKGLRWYKAHLPRKSDVSEGDIVGEVADDCLFYPLAAERIKNLIPDTKIIILLRNPTQRAISSYYFHKGRNRKCANVPIEEALNFKNDIYKTITDYEKLELKNHQDFFSKNFFLSLGLYLEHIKRFEKHFSKDQILILKSEDFFNSTEQTLKQIYDFLGIDSDFKITDLSAQNTGKHKKEVDPAIIDYLNSFYKPYNQELYEHLGKDFGW